MHVRKPHLHSCKCSLHSFKHVDGVLEGFLLGPLLTNVFMTQLGENIIQKLIDKKLIKFYIRYVGNTLLLVTP